MPTNVTFNIDCIEYMRDMPTDFFNLAIVDPPYGIADSPSRHKGSGTLKNRILNQQADKFAKWDIPPTPEYFDQLFRVSKNQIIWGGNYFNLPPTRCFVCWDKLQPWENFSACEYAWTSFDRPAKMFTYDNRTGDKIHPCQKPVELYAYLLRTFAKPGDKILDTHLGSGSSRIAAYKLGFDFYATEIDETYFQLQEERFAAECQGVITTPSGKQHQQLFPLPITPIPPIVS